MLPLCRQVPGLGTVSVAGGAQAASADEARCGCAPRPANAASGSGLRGVVGCTGCCEQPIHTGRAMPEKPAFPANGTCCRYTAGEGLPSCARRGVRKHCQPMRLGQPPTPGRRTRRLVSDFAMWWGTPAATSRPFTSGVRCLKINHKLKIDSGYSSDPCTQVPSEPYRTSRGTCGCCTDRCGGRCRSRGLETAPVDEGRSGRSPPASERGELPAIPAMPSA